MGDASAAAGASPEPTMRFDSGLGSLAVVLRLLGLPADPVQLAHAYRPPSGAVDAATLLRAARESGLKARLISTTNDRLARLALPAIAELRDGGFVVLAKVLPEGLLVLDPAERRSRSVDSRTFAQQWTGRLILATTRARLVGAEREFSVAWFIPPLIKYRRLFGEVLASSLFLQLLALMTPLMFQVIIDKVIVHQSVSTLDVLVIGLVAVALFEAALGGLRSYVFAHTTTRVDVELGAQLFRHLVSLPMSYFQARRAGDSVARARELETIRSFLTGSTLTLVVDLAFTVVFVAVMFLFSPLLTGVVLASIPLYLGASALVTPILKRRLDQKFERGAENQAFLVETVTGIETVKSMAVERHMQRRWEEQLAGYVQASFRAGNLATQASQAIGLVNKLTLALLLWFGARLVIEGSLTIGELVAVNMLAARISAPVLRLGQLWQDFQQVRISLARLGDVLNTPGEQIGGAGRVAMPRLKGGVSFDHVLFRYRAEGPQILKDLSLEIPAGQVIGIVGSSGSGKSTLAKLIQRLHVPEAGRVLVDGVNLALLDPSALRRQIGVVLQDSVLFSGTIRDNIALAEPGMDLAAVITAAKLAGAHEFILGLPQGYETRVGERGSTLSGGQRQRIAIARALATNPRILILDEATSALDAESERVIHDNMRLIAQGRTVIIIAHRLSAVRNADRIVTVEDGRLVEDGSPGALLRQGGRYAALHRHQIGTVHG